MKKIFKNNQMRKHKHINNPKITLIYAPNQSWPDTMCKPNGSLAYPSLGGALIEAGIEVKVFDACVGNEKDDLKEMFYKSKELPSGLYRTGVSDQRILDEVENSDVVGLTSIFTDQETMVLSTAKLIKDAYPEKLIVAGGVNARNRIEIFLANSVDIVCLSEAEKTLINILDEVRKGSRDFSKISSVAFQKDGRVVINQTTLNDIAMDLDQLPMPAVQLLPNERYWSIARPHGGHFESVKDLRYGSMMTSRGCVFRCSYCHIAGETEESVANRIGKFRIKSDERVLAEIEQLKKLGVKQVFIEDDSLLGHKKRGLRLLRKIRGAGVDIFPMNGVNLIHLFKGSEPDIEVLEALKEAGFKELVLPFETGSSRIMKKYVSNKFDSKRFNVEKLLHICKEFGFKTAGNYMIGYPDETLEELNQTIDMARIHRSFGVDSVYFLIVIPLPGTLLYDMVLKSGQLPADWNPDRITWMKANLINTCIPPEELEEKRQSAFRELNDSDFVKYKMKMNVPKSD